MRRVTFLLPLTSGSAVRESIETVLSRVVAENRNLRCGKPSGLRAVARNALLPSFCARMRGRTRAVRTFESKYEFVRFDHVLMLR